MGTRTPVNALVMTDDQGNTYVLPYAMLSQTRVPIEEARHLLREATSHPPARGRSRRAFEIVGELALTDDRRPSRLLPE